MNKKNLAAIAAISFACLLSSAANARAQILPRLFQPAASYRVNNAQRLFPYFNNYARGYDVYNAYRAPAANASATAQGQYQAPQARQTAPAKNAPKLLNVGASTEQNEAAALTAASLSSVQDQAERTAEEKQVPEAGEIVLVGDQTQDEQAEKEDSAAIDAQEEQTPVAPDADAEDPESAEEQKDAPNAPQVDPVPEPTPAFDPLADELARVNSIRAQYGIGLALRIDSRLQAGAANHAANMRASGQVYHAPGCGFEICAQSFGATIDGAIRQFLNSPAHRAILLQAGFRSCGIGKYNDQYGRTYVAIRFGY